MNLLRFCLVLGLPFALALVQNACGQYAATSGAAQDIQLESDNGLPKDQAPAGSEGFEVLPMSASSQPCFRVGTVAKHQSFTDTDGRTTTLIFAPQETPAHQVIEFAGGTACPRVRVQVGAVESSVTLTAANRFSSRITVPIQDVSRSELIEVRIRSVERADNAYRMKLAYITHDSSLFTDVRGLFYGGSQPVGRRLDLMRLLGVTLGCEPNRFCAGETLRRAQLAVFLARLHSRGAVDVNYVPRAPIALPDVTPDHIFWKYVQYCMENSLLPRPSMTANGEYDGEVTYVDEVWVTGVLQRLGHLKARFPSEFPSRYSRIAVATWLMMNFYPQFP